MNCTMRYTTYFHRTRKVVPQVFRNAVLSTVFIISFLVSMGQAKTRVMLDKDTLLVVKHDPSRGFYNDYLLFIPKGTPLNKPIFLLVEPNNTGKISDSIEVHKQFA